MLASTQTQWKKIVACICIYSEPSITTH